MKHKVATLETLAAEISDAKRHLELLRKMYNKVEKELYYAMKDMPIGSVVKGVEMSAVINKITMCSINNWEEFLEYVHTNKQYSLLSKTVNNKQYAESLRKGNVIRGTQPYKKLGVKLVRNDDGKS